LVLVAGAALVPLILADAVATLVVTRARAARWRPSRLWYEATWHVTRSAAANLPSGGGDFVLNVYPALSLLGLLVLWLAGLCVAWACVYWGLTEAVAGSGDWVSLAYFSGTSLLTPAFGLLDGEGVRFLSLVETLSGLGTIALLISYLPALYGAYSRRETRLLTLDDPQGGRLTPFRVIAVHTSDGSLELFNRFCSDWEMWTAEVLESHTSYPMLALFRSQHPGQSWITALGVVTDAATLACACIIGAEVREPYFMYRRGRRALGDIAAALNITEIPADITGISKESVDAAWKGLSELGLDLRDADESWRRLRDLKGTYGEHLQQLIDYTLAPHGFWGHSAEATVVEEVARATAEARMRGRRRSNRASLPS
jgi:hypothetical protein